MQFVTEYYERNQRYTTTFCARDAAHADELIVKRRMGERFIAARFPYGRLPSEYILEWNWDEALHAACWLGMIGCASATLDGFDLLRDQGLIHTLSHLNQRQNAGLIRDHLNLGQRFLILGAYQRALDAEKLVPGFQRFDDDHPPALTRNNIVWESMSEIARRLSAERPDLFKRLNTFWEEPNA